MKKAKLELGYGVIILRLLLVNLKEMSKCAELCHVARNHMSSIHTYLFVGFILCKLQGRDKQHLTSVRTVKKEIVLHYKRLKHFSKLQLTVYLIQEFGVTEHSTTILNSMCCFDFEFFTVKKFAC